MSPPDGLPELLDAEQPALDLRHVRTIPVPDPLLETVEPCLLVVDQLETLVPVMGTQRVDITSVRVRCPRQLQLASNGRIGGSGLAECERLRVDVSGGGAPTRATPAFGWGRRAPL